MTHAFPGLLSVFLVVDGTSVSSTKNYYFSFSKKGVALRFSRAYGIQEYHNISSHIHVVEEFKDIGAVGFDLTGAGHDTQVTPTSNIRKAANTKRTKRSYL